jgi:hypothetical protein
VIDDISHEGLRTLLREEGVTFQRLKTWKTSNDPHYQAKKARIEHLYAIADRTVTPQPGDPKVIFCLDEFGPLNPQPRPGRQWAPIGDKGKEPGRAPRRRRRATYTPPPPGCGTRSPLDYIAVRRVLAPDAGLPAGVGRHRHPATQPGAVLRAGRADHGDAHRRVTQHIAMLHPPLTVENSRSPPSRPTHTTEANDLWHP